MAIRAVHDFDPFSSNYDACELPIDALVTRILLCLSMTMAHNVLPSQDFGLLLRSQLHELTRQIACRHAMSLFLSIDTQRY